MNFLHGCIEQIYIQQQPVSKEFKARVDHIIYSLNLVTERLNKNNKQTNISAKNDDVIRQHTLAP